MKIPLLLMRIHTCSIQQLIHSVLISLTEIVFCASYISCYRSGKTCYLSFGEWLISLSIMVFSEVCCVANGKISFL